MKRIFLDTNFIIDYLLREDYKLEAQNFLASATQQGCKFYVSYLTIANFAYIARKIQKEKLYEYLSILCNLFQVVNNDSQQIQNAINIKADDFEDALQYEAARSVKSDCIISRNIKDFEFSQIPVLSARMYLDNQSFTQR